MSQELVEQLAKDLGGSIEEIHGPLPDGSGFAVVSFPLPKDHWIYTTELPGERGNVPPMPWRMGTHNTAHVHVSGQDHQAPLSREQMAQLIRAAGRYAVRCATYNGREIDFDPDALLRSLVVGLLGYWTPDGLITDE